MRVRWVILCCPFKWRTCSCVRLTTLYSENIFTIHHTASLLLNRNRERENMKERNNKNSNFNRWSESSTYIYIYAVIHATSPPCREQRRSHPQPRPFTQPPRIIYYGYIFCSYLQIGFVYSCSYIRFGFLCAAHACYSIFLALSVPLPLTSSVRY